MSEEELIELNFDKVVVTIEESGDKNDYYYYKYNLNDNFVLMSNPSDEKEAGQWYVNDWDLGIKIKDIEDVELLIALFRKWSKIV